MKRLSTLALLLALSTPAAVAQEPCPVDPTSQRGCAARTVAGLPTWSLAVAEAERTGRPILLVFGVPAHEGTPGVW